VDNTKSNAIGDEFTTKGNNSRNNFTTKTIATTAAIQFLVGNAILLEELQQELKRTNDVYLK